MDDILDTTLSAIALYEKGFYVFRVNGHDKRPFAKGWQREAMYTEPKYLNWENKNVGIYTECLDDDRFLCVIDVDLHGVSNGYETLEKLHNEGFTLPDTYSVRTPTGGMHLYYVHTSALSSGANCLGPGVDIRASGGYVLGVGSFKYEAQNDLPLAPLPEWVATRLTAVKERAPLHDLPPEGVELSTPAALERARTYLIDNAPEAIEGAGGNSTTLQIAFILRDFGLEQIDTLELMACHWNGIKAFPEWSWEELEKIVENAYTYAKKQIGIESPQADFLDPPRMEDVMDTPSKFHAKSFRNDAAKPVTGGLYLIDHLLMQNAFSMMIGESNVGKTFIALDLAYHIVCGQPWRGYKVKACSVLYIATEGTQGIQNRIVGVMRQYPNFSSRPNYIYTIYQSVDFHNNNTDLNEVRKFMAEIEERDGCKFGLVVVDTLSRVLAGGNENASEDIGRVIARFDKLRDTTGAHIMLVHHKGKDTTRGGRGHSKLGCDIDTVIDILSTGPDTGVIEMPKQKEDGKAKPIGFKRITLEIGKRDEDSEPITTCAIIPHDVPVPLADDFKDELSNLTVKDRLAASALRDAIALFGEPIPGCDQDDPQFHVKEAPWKEAYFELAGGNNNSTRIAFNRSMARLIDKRVIEHRKNHWRLL